MRQLKPGADGAPAVVVVSREELAELIRGAVENALADQREGGALLLDRPGIARALGVGVSTVDRLRREGLPCVLIGDSPRFLADECIGWFMQQRGTHPGGVGT